MTDKDTPWEIIFPLYEYSNYNLKETFAIEFLGKHKFSKLNNFVILNSAWPNLRWSWEYL